MKREYNNVKRFDETYYAAPIRFYNELIQNDRLKEDEEYSLCHVPQSTENGVIADLYSVITKYDSIELQFKRKYNTKDNTLIIELVK